MIISKNTNIKIIKELNENENSSSITDKSISSDNNIEDINDKNNKIRTILTIPKE